MGRATKVRETVQRYAGFFLVSMALMFRAVYCHDYRKQFCSGGATSLHAKPHPQFYS